MHKKLNAPTSCLLGIAKYLLILIVLVNLQSFLDFFHKKDRHVMLPSPSSQKWLHISFLLQIHRIKKNIPRKNFEQKNFAISLHNDMQAPITSNLNFKIDKKFRKCL